MMSGVNKKLLIVVLILAVILIVIIAVIGGYYIGSRNTSADSQTPDSSVASVPENGKGEVDGSFSKGKQEQSDTGAVITSTFSDTSSDTSQTSSVSESSSSSVPESSSSQTQESSAEQSTSQEALTTRQILDSSMYWADDSGKFGLTACAKGEFDVLLDDEVYHTTQIITVDEDKIDGFTYNMIMELENYSTGVISTVPLYCHQMSYGKGIHIQLMMWDGTVKYLEPSDTDLLAKFQQNP